jgi:nucleoside-diphosphate-sugar epimerase
MRRLLLTGADGFTGRHLSKLAALEGYDVSALRADLLDLASLNSEINAVLPTHIIHLAAISSVTHGDQEEIYKVNLFGTLNLLEVLAKLPLIPEKVLLASSANVYGNSDISVIDESIFPNPINHYAMSKLAMEHMAMTYGHRLPILISRPFNYTGIGHDTRFIVPKIFQHFVKRASEIELGNIDVYREYNDVRMVCEAYLKLLQLGLSGQIYNVCSGNAYSLREVISLFEAITQHNINVVVNHNLIRQNEVHTLVGCPNKMLNVTGGIRQYSLEDTLRWMLQDV